MALGRIGFAISGSSSMENTDLLTSSHIIWDLLGCNVTSNSVSFSRDIHPDKLLKQVGDDKEGKTT